MIDRSLAEWLVHLETLHPKSIDLGLDRVRAVARALALLDCRPRTITVAGTNGKGSCVGALDHLLRHTGASVGVYTSPHLRRYNERIVIDGRPVEDAAILEAFTAIEQARGDTSLSYFEFATLAALWLFQRAGVDWQILEVGLGGRLDAVNIVDADACVITSIGIDHTEWLGETRELIAQEKAGVAREGCPAVVAEREAPDTLRPALEGLGAQVSQLGSEWSLHDECLRLPGGREVPFRCPDSLQASNVGAAVSVLSLLRVDLPNDLLAREVERIQVPGRQQRISWLQRELWFDVAHNRESVNALVAALSKSTSQGHTHAVFGGMSDKPLQDMLRAMAPAVDHWHFPALGELPRAASPSAIAALLPGDNYSLYASTNALADRLLSSTQPGDRVVVFGSFVTVGALLDELVPEAERVPDTPLQAMP